MKLHLAIIPAIAISLFIANKAIAIPESPQSVIAPSSSNYDGWMKVSKETTIGRKLINRSPFGYEPVEYKRISKGRYKVVGYSHTTMYYKWYFIERINASTTVDVCVLKHICKKL
ncbi:MAG: hypothetical protein KAH32_08435 [Chlamydiia bacterium]|nr:hypothetical protein [Chlamydiia bacterium]